ncbi:MAG: alpha/beta hydrolase [Sphingobacteriaceae bacterium]
MKLRFFILFFFVLTFCNSQTDQVMPSLDGVLIHGELYESKNPNGKVMLLCHQAKYSKGEYKETAPKFNKLGYTCLAIDQRSGEAVNDDVNLTARNAKDQGLPTEFENAEQDIKAALYFLFEKYGKKIILVGSSYSSSLILKIASEEKDKVEMVVSFSPGEYFKDDKIINKSLQKLETPVFITCSQEEIKNTTALLDGVDNKKMVFFKPAKEGKHGSKALWENNSNNKEYWKALTEFLKPSK